MMCVWGRACPLFWLLLPKDWDRHGVPRVEDGRFPGVSHDATHAEVGPRLFAAAASFAGTAGRCGDEKGVRFGRKRMGGSLEFFTFGEENKIRKKRLDSGKMAMFGIERVRFCIKLGGGGGEGVEIPRNGRFKYRYDSVKRSEIQYEKCDLEILPAPTIPPIPSPPSRIL